MLTQKMDEPKNAMEKALIEEYLVGQGYSREKLKDLPEELVKKLMQEATRYASLKLEEIQARAHFVEEIHDGGSSRE